MIPDLGKYTVEVIASYGAALTLLGSLICVMSVRSWRISKALRAAEERRRA